LSQRFSTSVILTQATLTLTLTLTLTHKQVANNDTDGITILSNLDGEEVSAQFKADRAPYHYMDRISSFSFGNDGWFATCQESPNNYNGMKAPNFFMGASSSPMGNVPCCVQRGLGLGLTLKLGLGLPGLVTLTLTLALTLTQTITLTRTITLSLVAYQRGLGLGLGLGLPGLV